MSIEVPKNLNIYLIIALVTGGSFFVSMNNQNTTQTVTEDKVDALEERLEKAEARIIGLESKISDHDSLFAHPGIFERTNSMLALIDNIAERVTFHEREE